MTSCTWSSRMALGISIRRQTGGLEPWELTLTRCTVVAACFGKRGSFWVTTRLPPTNVCWPSWLNSCCIRSSAPFASFPSSILASSSIDGTGSFGMPAIVPGIAQILRLIQHLGLRRCQSNAPGSQDSVTGGAGGPAVSHACRAVISGPGFFLDLGKDRTRARPGRTRGSRRNRGHVAAAAQRGRPPSGGARRRRATGLAGNGAGTVRRPARPGRAGRLGPGPRARRRGLGVARGRGRRRGTGGEGPGRGAQPTLGRHAGGRPGWLPRGEAGRRPPRPWGICGGLPGCCSGGAAAPLHLFQIGKKRYGDPFVQLDRTGDEEAVRVRHAMAPGGTIAYTYDLGACWEHEITLEATVPRDHSQDYPVCVAFRGDSPVEYWCEEEPEEPEPFGQNEVNRRLPHWAGSRRERGPRRGGTRCPHRAQRRTEAGPAPPEGPVPTSASTVRASR